MDVQTDRYFQTDRQTIREADRQTDIFSLFERQTDRPVFSERQTNSKQTDR